MDDRRGTVIVAALAAAVIVAVVVVAAAVVVAGTRSESTGDRDRETAAVADRDQEQGDPGPGGAPGSLDATGEAVYRSNCATCHGNEGQGGIGPALDDLALDREAATDVVTDGRPPMPAFGGSLTPKEIDAVVAYLQD